MVRRVPQRTEGLSARLRQVVASYGSVTSFAAAIDRSEGAVRKWLRGEAEPNATDLRLLSTATGASVEWLVSGGDLQVSASIVMRYLAYVMYQRDSGALKTEIADWAALTTSQRRAFNRRARAELSAWALTDAARAED